MREQFHEQLAFLNQELIAMGALCEEAIALVSSALSEGNPKSASRVSPLDQEIDQKERSIEALCLKLLLQQQPVARDWRQISAALKMVTDLQRIGDQAENIAEIILLLNGRTHAEHVQVREMATAACKMVTDSVDAYVKQDAALADAVIAYDDIVDECFLKVRDSLIRIIAENPENGGDALDLLMIAKYFERIGDHAVNIAGWVHFSVTGHKPRA